MLKKGWLAHLKASVIIVCIVFCSYELMLYSYNEGRIFIMSQHPNSCLRDRDFYTLDRIIERRKGRIDYVLNNTLQGTCEDSYHTETLVTFCKEENILLIVYVESAPGNFLRRKLIRETWGNPKLHDSALVKTVFLCGLTQDTDTQKQIHQENATYGDILQGEFIDSYANLTLKGAVGLQWATEYCSNAKFVLKTDDDVLVDIFLLVEHLEERVKTKNTSQVLDCALINKDKPTLRKGKYWVSHDEYPFPGYPHYCIGAGYVMSMDIAQKMSKASRRMPLFPMEDIYFTGFMRLDLKIDIGKVLKLVDYQYLHLPTNYGTVTFYLCNPKDKKYFDIWHDLLKINVNWKVLKV